MEDDLSKKSLNELKQIMMESIGNQHIPGSIYHKAKLEIELRKLTSDDDLTVSPQNDLLPCISRDGKLVSRLIVVLIGGFDEDLDKKSALFLRILSRLVDKSYDEYNSAISYVEKEIDLKDKLTYRFEIINHFENCINALHRAIVVVRELSERSQKYDIIQYIDSEKLKIVSRLRVPIRHRVEHLDEDISQKEYCGGIFLDIDEEYKKICIGDKSLTLVKLAKMIEDYHGFVLDIFTKMPGTRN